MQDDYETLKLWNNEMQDDYETYKCPSYKCFFGTFCEFSWKRIVLNGKFISLKQIVKNGAF